MDRIDQRLISDYVPGPQRSPRAESKEGPRDEISLSDEKSRKLESDPALLAKTIQSLPKVDIHRHLEGAIKPESALRIAQKYGITLPSNTVEGLRPHLCVTDKDKTLIDFLEKFSVIRKLWVNTDAIKELSEQCVLDAKEENVKAMELRFAPTSMAAGNNLGLREIIDAVIEGVREGEKKTGIVVGLTTIIPRHKGVEIGKEIENLTDEYVKKGMLNREYDAASSGKREPFASVTSIDLACDEANFPPAPYAPVFIESENEGIHRTIHAGEARGADSVKDALDMCHAERIGHGVRAFEDPALVQRLVDGGVILEMCPTSNIQTGAVDSLERHPLKKFYDMGGHVTINTDDPGVCDTDLNREYLKAIRNMGCRVADIEHMILYAVDAMFIPPQLKATLRESILAEIKRINESV